MFLVSIVSMKGKKKVKELSYKGYIIEAASQQLLNDKRWTIDIHIWKHRGDSSTQRKFSASNTFDNKEEAIQHCFNLGKQIIDGQVENCTIADL